VLGVSNVSDSAGVSFESRLLLLTKVELLLLFGSVKCLGKMILIEAQIPFSLESKVYWE
jgi:hypothetical protein